MKHKKEAFFKIKNEEEGRGLLVLIGLFIIGFLLNFYFYSRFSIWGVILYNLRGWPIVIVLFLPDIRVYCDNCKKFVMPIFRDQTPKNLLGSKIPNIF